MQSCGGCSQSKRKLCESRFSFRLFSSTLSSTASGPRRKKGGWLARLESSVQLVITSDSIFFRVGRYFQLSLYLVTNVTRFQGQTDSKSKFNNDVDAMNHLRRKSQRKETKERDKDLEKDRKSKLKVFDVGSFSKFPAASLIGFPQSWCSCMTD